MTKKEFIKKAIKAEAESNENKVYTKGWDWIRENLKKLDYIFQTKEYKECDGYKAKCMPFLIEKDDLSEEEESILGTAWYLNNDRMHKQQKIDKIKRFKEKGFVQIENNEKYDGKKIEFIIDNSDEMFSRITQLKGKLCWSKTDKLLMAMKTRCTRRGYWITPNIYIKLLN